MNPEERTRRWLREVVIGLNLCPFAAAVERAGTVRIVVSGAAGDDAAIRDVLGEVVTLVETAPEAIATTLVVFPEALGDFEAFLDVVAEIEGALESGGADELVQLAHFHPDYRFEGEPAEGVSHFTNRAPYPIVHVLRVDDVADAVDRHPDPEGIPAANIARLEQLGRAAVEALWGGFRAR